jgi:hypothetical protein
MSTRKRNDPALRWISVVFTQGDEAQELLAMIDQRGPAAAIEHLRQWDVGEGTVEATLENGYVYDRIPAGRSDLTIESETMPYALTYSAQFRYVSLLRRHEAYTELVVPLRAATMARCHRDIADPWVAPHARPTTHAGHTVGS